METRPFDLQRQVLGEGARGVQLALQGAHAGLPGLQLQGQVLGTAGLGLGVLLHPLELPLQDLELPPRLVMLGDRRPEARGWCKASSYIYIQGI